MQKGEITLGKDETVKTAIVRLWQDTNPWGPYLLNAVKAEHLYLRDKDYIVTKQNEVKIINIVTGRVMPISRWQDNIHQVRCPFAFCCWSAFTAA